MRRVWRWGLEVARAEAAEKEKEATSQQSPLDTWAGGGASVRGTQDPAWLQLLVGKDDATHPRCEGGVS